jgi:hypothetical protein
MGLIGGLYNISPLSVLPISGVHTKVSRYSVMDMVRAVPELPWQSGKSREVAWWLMGLIFRPLRASCVVGIDDLALPALLLSRTAVAVCIKSMTWNRWYWNLVRWLGWF